LRRFRDMAFDRSDIAIDVAIPLAFNPPTEGFHWDDFRKILPEGQRMDKMQNGVKRLPKISTG